MISLGGLPVYCGPAAPRIWTKPPLQILQGINTFCWLTGKCSVISLTMLAKLVREVRTWIGSLKSLRLLVNGTLTRKLWENAHLYTWNLLTKHHIHQLTHISEGYRKEIVSQIVSHMLAYRRHRRRKASHHQSRIHREEQREGTTAHSPHRDL